MNNTKYKVGDKVYLVSNLFPNGLIGAVVTFINYHGDNYLYIVTVDSDISNISGLYIDEPLIINADNTICTFEDLLVPYTETSKILYGKI